MTDFTNKQKLTGWWATGIATVTLSVMVILAVWHFEIHQVDVNYDIQTDRIAACTTSGIDVVGCLEALEAE
jgi:hypothetical protein